MNSFMKLNTSFDASKVKANLRMASTRIGIQRKKLSNNLKAQRRGIAELLSNDKYDSARINVEACIRDDLCIEGMEVLSLFLDLLSQRVQLIAEWEAGKRAGGRRSNSTSYPLELKEAISSVIWASVRVADKAPELHAVRKAFEAKFGKEFIDISLQNTEFSVNPQIIERFSTAVPSNEKCLSYLSAIAEEFDLASFDEARLRDSTTLVGAVAEVAKAWDGPNKTPLGCFLTPSGAFIPPLNEPYDALDRCLVRLKRS
ncbi:unnamed protein product [Phytomonas sp. Hart1]|nr:unnamed protein product [Phytomonas sp. Hart1]|eukprot:CCW67640.1 unnamed protein product [Phytomonas sp. isolate Hart1]